MVAPMLRRSVSLVGTLALSAAGLPLGAETLPEEVAARPETIRLTPASAWNIDFGESKCRLQRFFGPDDQRHVLIIEQNVPQDVFGLIVAGPSVARLKGVKTVSVGLVSNLPLRPEPGIMSGTLAEYGSALFTTRLTFTPPVVSGEPSKSGVKQVAPIEGETKKAERVLSSAVLALDEAATVKRIVLSDGKGNKAISFETGNLKDAVAALNACTSDLLSQWGLDPEKHLQYQPPRLTNYRQVAESVARNYPSRAADKGESGVFTLRLIVEADGTISDCHFEARTKVTELEPQCRQILRLAQMAPALDAEGKPMKSFYFTQVTYKLF